MPGDLLSLFKQMNAKSNAPNGNQIIEDAIDYAKEALDTYREEMALEDAVGEIASVGKASAGLGGMVSGFFESVGGALVLGVGALVIGFISGALASLNGGLLFAGFKVPGDMDNDELEVYQNALIEAFGYTGFQVDTWDNWVDAESYIYNGGFTNEDNGKGIKGLLQDGEYYRIR